MSIPVAMVSVGLLVFLAHLFAAIFQRFRVPDTVWLIGIGILLGPIFQVLKPEDFGVVGAIFTTIALVVILFEAGLDLSFKSLRESLASTMRITLGCYVLTTAVVTTVVYFLGDFPLITALFIGAVIAGPSPPVIIPMVKSLNLRERNKTLLTLESAVGEAICLVIALAILRWHRVEPADEGAAVDLTSSTGTIGEIIAAFVIAVIIGALGGIVWGVLLEKVRQLKNTISTTLSFVFIVYGLCEMLGYSGPVAALLFGITIGNIQFFRHLPIFSPEGPWQPSNHSATEVMFFSEIVFLLKTFFFVFLGISMNLSDLTSPVALVIIGVLLLARLLAVKVTLNRKIHIAKEGLFLSVMIPKGLAAAVLGALAAQPGSGLPHGDEAENLIYAVIFYSILASALLVFLIDKAHIHRAFYWLFPYREEALEGDPPPAEHAELTATPESSTEATPKPEPETTEAKEGVPETPAGGNPENEKKVRESIEAGLAEAEERQTDGDSHDTHKHPDRSLADLSVAGEEPVDPKDKDPGKYS